MIEKVYTIVYDCSVPLHFSKVLVYNVNIHIENECSENIDFIIYMVYILCKGISNNCSAAQERRCVHMKKVSKDFVIEWVQRIPDEDEKFLRQLYTIIKKHLERTGKH